MGKGGGGEVKVILQLFPFSPLFQLCTHKVPLLDVNS